MRKLSHLMPHALAELLNTKAKLCVGCQQPSLTGLCQTCSTQLPWNTHACERCAHPMPSMKDAALICGACLTQPPPWQSAYASFVLDWPVHAMLKAFKFSGQRHVGEALSEHLARYLKPQLFSRELPKPQCLVPVPLYPWREYRRRFNQAHDIAHTLSRALDIPLNAELLERRLYAQAQSGLSKTARLRNLKKVFHANKPASLTHVAVIDDVHTTGATAHAVTRALNKQGIKHVEIWTLARTPKR